MNSRKWIAGAASALIAASSIAGCSSTGGSSTGDASGTLTVGTTQELKGVFSPLYVSTAYDNWISNLVYQSLTSYNADNERVPELAEELPTVSEDGMTITFKLKQGQKFSNGEEVTAEDVKFTYTLMADPEYIGGRNDGVYNFIEGWEEYQKGDAEEVSGIIVEDDYTVTFKCATPDIEAANTLGGMAVMPKGQFEYSKGNLGGYKDQTTDIIGSGPYKLNKYDKAAGASVVLNENYTGEGEYKVSQIIVRTIASGTELASLESGEIDLLPEQIDTSIIGPASLNENLTTAHHFRAAEGYFGYNTANGATADKAVRQALSYAVNRAEFVDTYYKWPEKDGTAQVSDDLKDVSTGYVPAAFWTPVGNGTGQYTTGAETLDGLTVYDYDLEKAKSILDEAGWTVGSDGIREKDGQKLEIKMLATESNPVLEVLIPIVEKSWTDLGVSLKKNTIDFNTMLDVIEPTSDQVNEWNIFFLAVSFTGLSNTTMNNILGYDGSGDDIVLGSSNYSRLVNEELNGYLNAGKETGVEEVSLENYRKAMVLSSDLVPYLPIYGNNLFNIYNKRVKNLKTGVVCNWSQSMNGVYLED
jgi:peptide/nickel transport system substrate-binding protein